jgi:hypothetical protein
VNDPVAVLMAIVAVAVVAAGTKEGAGAAVKILARWVGVGIVATSTDVASLATGAATAIASSPRRMSRLLQPKKRSQVSYSSRSTRSILEI